MEVIKSGTNMVRSNSKIFTQSLLWLLIFMMLPIDSLLRINVQNKVMSPLNDLLSNDLVRVVLAFVFYLIYSTGDVLLLLLYLCFLNKLGIF
jgi:uncharacterized membrane protein